MSHGAFFVTATGTDVGKTYVAAGLLRHFRARGLAPDALKPVASGFEPSQPNGSDPAVLLEALERPATMGEIARISPWRFRAPLSPDMAAAREGREIDFAALVDLCRERVAASAPDRPLLIEGVGGVMVPLDATRTVLDWMAELRLPVLLVCGSYLGTISHTLTALAVLRARQLDLRGIVVDETAGSTVSLAETVASITRFASPLPVIPLPRDAGERHPAFRRIAALVCA